MTGSLRFRSRANREINKDSFIQEWPETGLVLFNSPADPKPRIRIQGGRIVELDGRPEAEFDILDRFIARRAIDVGCDAVIVSNHGGRQLDGAPATMRVLPDIAQALGGAAAVVLDSGVRRGSDVVKALAAGADAVMIGRAYLYGLATCGEQGVRRVLDVLHTEMVRTLSLMGCPSVSDLDPSWLEAPGATSR